MDRFIVQQKQENDLFNIIWIDLLCTRSYKVAQEYTNYIRNSSGKETRIIKLCNDGIRKSKQVIKNKGGGQYDTKRKNKTGRD